MVTLDQAGLDSGITVTLRHDEKLREFVESISVIKMTGAVSEWRIVPDDAAHILLQYNMTHSGVKGRLVVVGARTAYTDINRSARVLTVAARLRLGALSGLIRCPAHEFTDCAHDLSSVLGGTYRDATTKVVEVGLLSPADEMHAFLTKLARSARPVERRVQALFVDSGRAEESVAAMTRLTGLSARGVNGLFHREVGMPPKRVLRIRRLHRCLSSALAKELPRWTAEACDARYHDSPHFIRECRALLGETPTQFARRRGADVARSEPPAREVRRSADLYNRSPRSAI